MPLVERMPIRLLAIDTETTISNKGSPYDQTNQLVCISWSTPEQAGAARVSPPLIIALQKLIDEADLIIGFNFKFDMHWLKKAGLRLDHKRLYDCQSAEFVITRQQHRYPSLEDCAAKYGLGHKLDIIKLEYWNKGIDTTEIPWPVLKEYAIQDARLTLSLYEAQKAHITSAQTILLKILNEDLKVLQEMEENGLVYDEQLCKERSDAIQIEIQKRRDTLNSFYPDVPINWASGDQLSSFLYGGTISEAVKEHDGFYKSGLKKGQPKYKNATIEHQLPRLYTPLKGTELAKEGFYSTNEDTLLKLTGKRGPLTVLLELSKLEKIQGTYYLGLPKLNAEMHWRSGTLHPTYNTCVAQTGRLSSTKPNGQNFASELKDIFITRNPCTQSISPD